MTHEPKAHEPQSIEEVAQSLGSMAKARFSHYLAERMTQYFKEHSSDQPNLFEDPEEVYQTLETEIDDLIRELSEHHDHVIIFARQKVDSDPDRFRAHVIRLMDVRKYWLADDGQSDLGHWPLYMTEDEIRDEIHWVGTSGTIKAGEYTA